MRLLQLIVAVRRVTGAASMDAASSTVPGVTAQMIAETAQTSGLATVSAEGMFVRVEY